MQKTLNAGEFRRKDRLLELINARRSKIVEVISCTFILLFTYTAVSKLSDVPRFQSVLSKSPLIKDYAFTISWGLPLLELLVSLFLFLPRLRRIGLYASLVMMAGFTMYIGYMIYFTPHLPCSCGGVLSQMNWTQHLIFNVVFTLLAVGGVYLHRKTQNV